MPLYSSFKYAEQKYGTGSTSGLPNFLWSISVDWNNDGYFSGDNEADRCISFDLQRGRKYPLTSAGIAHYQPGRVTMLWDNSDGRYDFFNSSSPIYPNISPGKFIVIKVRDMATLVQYSVFYGRISDIVPVRRGGIKYVKVVAEDGLRFLSNQIINAATQTSIQYDNIVQSYILTEVGWPTDYWTIQGNLTAQSLNWWWEWGRNALDTINDLSDCAGGVFYHSRFGQARFRPGNNATILATIDIDESECLRDISVSQPWDVIRNKVAVQIHRKYSIANTDYLWGDGGFNTYYPVDAREVVEWDVELRPDPGLPGLPSMETAALELTDDPSAFMTGLKMFVADSGGGLGVCTWRLLKFSSHMQFVAKNEEIDDQYMFGYAQPATTVNMLYPATQQAGDTASQADFGTRELSINTRYIESTQYGKKIAAYYLSKFKDAAPYPVISVENRPATQFTPDLYDYRFNLTAPSIGITSATLFRIGGIQHQWVTQNGSGVRSTFWLEPYIAPLVL